MDIKQFAYQEWGRLANAYQLPAVDFNRGYGYVRDTTNIISNARVINQNDDPARLEDEMYAIVEGAVQWAIVQILTELRYPEQTYAQYFPAYDAIAAKLDQIEAGARQPAYPIDPRYSRQQADPIYHRPGPVYNAPVPTTFRRPPSTVANDALGSSRLSTILSTNMDINKLMNNNNAADPQFVAFTDQSVIRHPPVPKTPVKEVLVGEVIDIPVRTKNTLSIADLFLLRTEQGADSITENIINVIANGNTAELVYRVDETVINLSPTSDIEGFIALATELQGYTSLYEAILKIYRFKDVRLINLINNTLNHVVSEEAFNRYEVVVPNQQFFVKWDNYQAFESEHGLLGLREIMIRELLSFFDNLEISDDSQSYIIARHAVPVVCIADLLSVLPSKKMLVSTAMSENSFYKFAHNCFSAMVQLGYTDSTVQVLDRSLTMFEITEHGPHTLAPMTGYTAKRIKQKI